VVVGAPYQIGNVTFVPSDSMNFDSVGYALVGTDGGQTISARITRCPCLLMPK
jgi:rare lipoprotein A